MDKTTSSPPCDLLIFTVRGRSHLLRETWRSFRQNCNHPFERIILSLAGWDENYWPVIAEIKPDVILWDWEVPGYYASARRALLESRAPYHFWLEDDWQFLRELPVDEMLAALMKDNLLCQVTLSPKDNHDEGVIVGNVGWMVATVPHLANGDLMRARVAHSDVSTILKEKDQLTIEVYIAHCLTGCRVARLGAKNGAPMTHIGALYSSDRQLVAVKGSCGQDVENAEMAAQVAGNIEEHEESSLTNYDKAMFHAGTFLRAIRLFGSALIKYGFSKKHRDFVVRSLQYMKNTHGWV